MAVSGTMAAGGLWQLSWTAWRDRLLSSARFQRFAVVFPLTRPIARRRARALFDVVAGFVYSQVLFACVRLHLFDVLAAGPQTVDVLAARLDLPPGNALRLLEAAASLRLTQRHRDGRFGLGDLGAAMVGNPGIAAMVEHHAMLYADLRDPVALLRGESGQTALGAYWPYARAESPTDAGAGPYTDLMAASQALVADEVLDAYRLGRHRCVLDIGGGDGSFLRAVARRAPRLRLKLFDLPPVAAIALARFAAAGLQSQADVTGGSFLTEDLPQGADVATLVRVLHDHDDDSVLAILRAARRALPPDGVLLVAEPMAETSGAEPMGAAYFGFYLLAMGSGRPRTPAALESLLRQAGFTKIRLLPTRRPLLARVMTASPSDGGV